MFVFGKRAKKMRLKKLSELIHSSTTQPNLTFARVTVEFIEIRDLEGKDNYEIIAGREFSLSREVNKSSASKYYYNGEVKLFDEIAEIVKSKGIDLKHNRFLILQGEVEQISLMKPKAQKKDEIGMLEFLEDIIGTSRFVNLIERLTVSIDELQDIKAKKANRCKADEKDLSELENVKDSAIQYYEKEKEAFKLNNLKLMINKIITEQKKFHKENELREFKRKFAELESKFHEIMEKNQSLVQAHAKMRERREELKKQEKKIQDEIEQLELKDKDLRFMMSNLFKEKGSEEKHLTKMNNDLTSLNLALDEAKKNVNKTISNCEKSRNLKEELQAEVTEMESKLLQATKELQARKTKIENELQPFDNKIKANQIIFDQNKNRIDEIAAKLGEQNELEGEKNNKIEKLREQLNEESGRIDILKSEMNTVINNVEKHVKLLHEAEEKRVVLNNEYENVMARINENKYNNKEDKYRSIILSKLLAGQESGILKGIMGRLGDLGSIDKTYDIAVSTATSLLDAIVVRTVNDGHACLDFASKNKLGRVNLMILEKISQSTKPQSYNCPAKTKRLFDLVTCAPELKPAFYYALRNTLVASDMEVAASIAYGQIRHRVVTLQGEVIEDTGVMSGGGKPKSGKMSNTAVVSGGEQTEELNAQSNSLKKQIDEIEAEIGDIRMFIGDCKKNSRELENMLNHKIRCRDETEKLLEEAENAEVARMNPARLKKLQEEMAKLKETNEELVQQISLNEKNSKTWRTKLSEVEKEIEEVAGSGLSDKKSKLKEIKEEFEKLESEMNKMQDILENYPRKEKDKRLEIKQSEKKIEMIEEKVKNLTEQVDGFEKEYNDKLGELNAIAAESENKEKIMQENNKEIEEFRIALGAIKKKKVDLQKEENDVIDSIKKLNDDIEKDKQHINENKIRYFNLQQEFKFIDDMIAEIGDKRQKMASDSEEVISKC